MQNDMNRNSEEIDNYSEEDYRRFFSFINSYREFIENKSKEELQQLQETIRKQRISELNNPPTSEEKAAREKYLRELYLGKLQGPIQWNPYDFPTGAYVEKPTRKLDLNKSLYENYTDYAQEHLDEMAVYIDETKKAYTHREILDLIDIAACGLEKMGIEKGDIVAIMLDGSIEEIVMPLAINKIGGIFKIADYSKNSDIVKHSLLNSDIKLAILEEHILKFPPFNSMFEETIEEATYPTFIVGSKEELTGKKKSISELMELGQERKSNTAHFDMDDIVCINNSSGTENGRPKPIAQSQRSMIDAIQKILYTDFPIGRGNVTIKCIPGFVGLGTITSMLAPFEAGGTIALMGADGGVVLEQLKAKMVKFINEFDSFIENYNLSKDAKVNLFVAPDYARYCDKENSIKNLNHVGTFMVAGSPMPDVYTISENLRNKGLPIYIVVWYGQNELLGVSGSLNHSTVSPELLVAGQPLKEVEVIVIDEKTHEVLPIGESGRILESSPGIFSHYPGLKQKSDAAKINLYGREWLSTDIGSLGADGRLKVEDRSFRIWADFKAPITDIAIKLASGVEGVHDCAIIKIPQEKGRENYSFEEIVACIKEKKGYSTSDIAKSIFETKILDSHEQVQEVIHIDEIPRNGSDKVDITKLTQYYIKHRYDDDCYRYDDCYQNEAFEKVYK